MSPRKIDKVDKLLISAGAMKAGTTWLYDVLSSHPMIISSPVKEIHYFAQEFVNWDVLSNEERVLRVRTYLNSIPLNYDVNSLSHDLRWFVSYLSNPVGPEWFIRLFNTYRPGSLTNGSYCAEFSNLSALIRNRGWERVREVSEKFKVIYTIRNPIDRCWSHLKFNSAFSGQKIDFFQMSTQDYRSAIMTADIFPHGSYHDFIIDMQKNLDSDEFKVMKFESFRLEPIDSLKILEIFLDITHHTYRQELIENQVNPSKIIPMPKEFLEAIKPFAIDELEKLSKLGFDVRDYTESLSA